MDYTTQLCGDDFMNHEIKDPVIKQPGWLMESIWPGHFFFVARLVNLPSSSTLPETNISPENRPLKKGDSYWKPSLSECNLIHHPSLPSFLGCSSHPSLTEHGLQHPADVQGHAGDGVVWNSLRLEDLDDLIEAVTWSETGWWFQRFVYFHPYLWGNDPIWRAYFSKG